MDDEESFDLSENYEEEESEDDEDDEVEFDVNKYVEGKFFWEENREDDDDYSEEDEEDPLDEEEKLKTLQDVFSCFPMAHIKRILRRDDVMGDLNTAANELLQEFPGMMSPHEFFKSQAANPPEPRTFQEEHWNCSEGQIPEAANGATISAPYEPQNRIPPNVRPKRRGKRARNQGRGRGMEQEPRVEGGGQWQWRDTEDAEYRGDRGRGRGGYDGQRRGGPRVGTGGWADGRFTQKEWYGSGEKNLIRGKQMDQNYQQTLLGSIYSGGQVGFKSQRGRGNRGGREYQRKPRGQDYSERRRSLQDQFQSSPQQFPYARERGASEDHREGFIRRDDRNVDKPALNKGWISTDDIDIEIVGHIGRFADDRVHTLAERDHESGEMVDIGRFAHGMYSVQSPPRRMNGNWMQSQGGMKQTRSMSAINQTFDEHRHDETLNEHNTTLFEPRKLLVSGLDEKTTDDGVSNFIEAMSRDEVEQVVMLGKGRALVTMIQDITNFSTIKQKGERRGLDSAKVSIEKVPLCRSILVSGISPQTTHDSIALYFESRRSNGGPVEEVKFEPGSKRAVVIFENPKDMERVVAQQEAKPHVISKVQVSVRIFHDFLETDEMFDQSDDQLESLSAAQESRSTQVSRKSAQGATGQQLHIAVDPDIVEYVTTSAHLDQWNNLLAAKKSELKWKPSSKLAVMMYHGEEASDSWQTDCIDSVQSFLGKFGGCDVEVNKDFWEAVKEQVASIRACLGADPPLIKGIENSLTLRIVCLSSDFKTYKEKLEAKLEEIYREENRKTYLKRKIPNVPEEHIVLLKKVKFAEKLQVKNKELVVLLDSETEEIYFEGPQPQFTEATMKFHKLISEMVEKKLNLSRGILQVLGSTQGLSEVKEELEANNVEAVFVIDEEAKIVGISSAHADKAVGLVNKLTLEEKVRVCEGSESLLKTPEWRELCDQINKRPRVCIHRNSWNDTWVAGFRGAVTESMKALQEFLDKNCKRKEEFKCPSQIMKRYLTELRQQEIHSLEVKLRSFDIKVQEGKDEHTLTISGKREGLKQAKKLLQALIAGAVSDKFDVKQPGLKKYFTDGRGDRLVKSVEKEQECVVQIECNFGQGRVGAEAATGDDDSTSSDNEDDYDDADDGLSSWVSPHGHKVSWKPGNIATEKAHTLVSTQGACALAFTKVVGGPLLSASPNTGEIVVSIGNKKLACSYVIHTTCCNWNGGTGEVTLRAITQKCLQKVEELGGDSVAFPIIGTGNLHFPPDVASRIMLEETINYCQTNQSSKVKDIRFVVYHQDQNLITAFQQEMKSIQTKHKHQPIKSEGLFNRVRSVLSRGSPRLGKHCVSIEVVQGDLTKQNTDAIINLSNKEMNLNTAGILSKAVALAGGSELEMECRQLGQQRGGTAVITTGGKMRQVRHVIHLISDGSNKQHLQYCLEECLRLAEAKSFQSISLPAIGTGNKGMTAADSAHLIFQALSKMKGTFRNIRKVRVVIFQPEMLQTFLQEQQKQTMADLSADPTAHSAKKDGIGIEVLLGDLTNEQTDAIVNINSTDMNMENAGALSKAVAQACGSQVIEDCKKLGPQPGGSVVLTQGGHLRAGHIIHMIPGLSDAHHLRMCLEKCLDRAEAEGYGAISLPAVATGRFGMSATDSAQLTFQALDNFSRRSHNLRKVRIVVFQAQMLQAFQREQQRCAISPARLDKTDLKSKQDKRQSLRDGTAMAEQSVTLSVTGKCQADVSKAVDALKKGLSEACVTMKVENEGVSKLSERQIFYLRRKAESCDVKVEFETDVDRVFVRGEPSDASGIIGEIWHEISERTRKDRDREQALLVSKNVEWRYEILGITMPFDSKANAKIELAHTKNEPVVTVSLRGEKFVIDVGANIGVGQQTQDQITVSRKVKGAEEGIPLPKNWTPMPQRDMTVHTVQLQPSSAEYQDVMRKVYATARNVQIQKIERVQNPHLYQSYMVLKQKMDKDNGGNNERQLFHGTSSNNISFINTQGFDRRHCGQHGTALGRGVYFARDASYSVRYAGGGPRGNCMYLARVLVGKYCQGNSSMMVPPAKDSSRPEILFESVVDCVRNPSIFVVFKDFQCYPEYLITF